MGGGHDADWRAVAGLGHSIHHITVGLISYTALAAKLFGSAVSRKAIEDNTAVLKKIDAGQAEIIRLLKAVVPAGAVAAGVQPSSAAGSNGRGGDGDSDVQSKCPVR